MAVKDYRDDPSGVAKCFELIVESQDPDWGNVDVMLDVWTEAESKDSSGKSFAEWSGERKRRCGWLLNWRDVWSHGSGRAGPCPQYRVIGAATRLTVSKYGRWRRSQAPGWLAPCPASFPTASPVAACDTVGARTLQLPQLCSPPSKATSVSQAPLPVLATGGVSMMQVLCL